MSLPVGVEVIEFPDVEALLAGWLKAHQSAPAYVGSLPQTLPRSCVFVRRTGGTQNDLVRDLAQVTIECRAKTSGGAERLAARCRALMGSLARVGGHGGVTVHEVREFTAPYLDPDPVNPKLSRYSATYQVTVRGVVATS